MAPAALAFETPPEEIEYPESDGEPMAETDEHRDDLAEIVFTLKRYYRDRDDVYVSGDLFVYYEEGNPKACRAPDVFVVFGVKPEQRRVYQTWKEDGKMPTVAIELTSKKTKKQDQDEKPALYASWGIEYLFLYDVLGEYLKPPLQGKRLGRDGDYHRLAGGAKGPLPCPPLGLDLILDEAGRLQLVDRETGKVVPRLRVELDQTLEAVRETAAALEREAQARRQAEERAEQAEKRVEQAEERVEQGLRRGVEDLCVVLGLAWSAERSAQVELMSASQLEALRQHLVHEKSWPKPFSDAPP
ncbi:MAG: Uma2 family endonuclease [bacterium]|nr:Uma2 family endonuclease [bacterium]